MRCAPIGGAGHPASGNVMQDQIEIINTHHGAYVLIVRYARISGLDVDEAASELLEKMDQGNEYYKTICQQGSCGAVDRQNPLQDS